MEKNYRGIIYICRGNTFSTNPVCHTENSSDFSPPYSSIHYTGRTRNAACLAYSGMNKGYEIEIIDEPRTSVTISNTDSFLPNKNKTFYPLSESQKEIFNHIFECLRTGKINPDELDEKL